MKGLDPLQNQKKASTFEVTEIPGEAPKPRWLRRARNSEERVKTSQAFGGGSNHQEGE